MIDYKDELLDHQQVNRVIERKYNPYFKRFFGIVKNVRIEQTVETYKPYWFVKILALAARPPLKPKKIKYVAFVDAVTGFAGLTYSFPQFVKIDTGELNIEKPQVDKHKMMSIINKVTEQQILRKYLLKRPELIINDSELIFLPYLKAKVYAGNTLNTLYINRISGEIDS